VIEQIITMIDEWPFPPLFGVISTPIMRPDGSLLVEEGYDPVTGFVLFNPPPMPPIPKHPCKQDALDALALLNNDLLKEFPFADNESRSVAMSMQWTPVLRSAFGAVPMHVTTSPEAGTGKSYLQDIASAIAIGERCAVLSVAEDQREEIEPHSRSNRSSHSTTCPMCCRAISFARSRNGRCCKSVRLAPATSCVSPTPSRYLLMATTSP
jgi:putative DNA primase/helicase